MILRELHDPRLGFITVTEVRMTGDLKVARVYVSVYGSEKEQEESLEALRHAKGYLRTQIGDRLPLRHVPELRFEVDETLKRTARLDALFAEMDDIDSGEDAGSAEAETPDDREGDGDGATRSGPSRGDDDG